MTKPVDLLTDDSELLWLVLDVQVGEELGDVGQLTLVGQLADFLRESLLGFIDGIISSS